MGPATGAGVANSAAKVASSKPAWLLPLAGPPIPAISLTPKEGGLLIGRHDATDVRLPAEAVSRNHARLFLESGRWMICDLKSRWGTFLNGCRIRPEIRIPLHPGDLIRIAPWTFNFSVDASALSRALVAVDDVERCQTLVRSTSVQRVGAMAEELLALLLESAAALHAAESDHALAVALLDAACRGSGMQNAAVLRAVDIEGRFDILASRSTAPATRATYSRSLLAAAAAGVVAQFPPGQFADVSHSIVQMQIDAALCIPLMLGPTAAGYLYLDSRGKQAAGLGAQWSNVVAFCLALGRIASLALANLKRIDVERRAALIEIELHAAADAQRWVLPRREVQVGSFRCFGESRPGRYVGGDFYDLIPLADGRLAVALGDVAGKGIAAAILMTTAQGFLHASLREQGRPDSAVAALHEFISPRRPDERFLTLWVGVLDAGAHTLQYVDAGHGYAMLLSPGREPEALDAGENLPIGAVEKAVYRLATVALPPTGQLLIVSDGVVEQPGATTPMAPASANPRDCFGLARVRAAAEELLTSPDPVGTLLDAVIRHAGAPRLADDTTVLAVRW